jgi:WD40 repeat protein/tRNA A-37 threonylcarbamoyl transferase component Bud32
MTAPLDPAPTTHDAATLAPGGPAAPSAAPPGYELLEELGRGGMGVVYKARQVKADRLVALKMILAGAHASPVELARFRTEAEAVARLQHPNIVQVHDVGEHGDLPFFSLELCPGGSLARKLAGTPLPPVDAARLVGALARAIQAAHLKGVIHRDLKPANVLLAEDGSPKITDFGLARKLDEAGQTNTGAVMGTPSYMAPEQAAGRGKEVGPAADIYALGAVLYECLTGRPPFRAATALDTIQQVVADEPVAPRVLSPRVPRDLETICLKCLRKEPAKRYASAADLADDLERFLDGVPVRARRAGAAERAWKWCRRRPAAAALLATLLAAAAASVAVGLWFTATLKAERDHARDQEGIASTERDRAREKQKEADDARAAADRSAAETAEQLRQTRSSLYTWGLGVLLQQVKRDPLAVRDQLEDVGRFPPELREAAWAWARRQARGEVAALHATAARTITLNYLPEDRHVPMGLAFSPNGRRVAVTDAWARNATFAVFDRTTGAELFRSSGPPGPVWALAFSPDGQTLAVGGPRGVALWDMAAGRLGATLDGAEGAFAVAFSRSGRTLAVGGAGVSLYDVASGALRARLELPGGARWVAFDAAGALVAAGGKEDVRVWRLSRAGETTFVTLTAVLPLPARSLHGALSPDGKWLATAVSGQTGVRLWPLVKGEADAATMLTGHTLALFAVAFTPDGLGLISVARRASTLMPTEPPGQEAKVWDLPTLTERRALVAPAELPLATALSPDGGLLATANVRGQVKLWNVADLSRPDQEHLLPGLTLAYDAASGLAVQARGQSLAVVGVTDGAVRHEVALSGPVPQIVSMSGCGRRLAGWCPDEQVRLWDAVAGHELWARPAPRARLALSPDGSRLALGGGDGTVRVWDTGPGAGSVSLAGHRPLVAALAWSPDGKTLAVGHYSAQPFPPDGRLRGEVRLWDVATARPRLDLLGEVVGVTHLAFSSDGRALATLGLEREPNPRLGQPRGFAEVQLWDTTTGQERACCFRRPTEAFLWPVGVGLGPDGLTLVSPRAGQTAFSRWSAPAGERCFGWRAPSPAEKPVIALSADGAVLAVACGDRLRLVSTAMAAERVVSPGPGAVVGLTFSADGARLAGLLRDGKKTTAKVWAVREGKEVASWPCDATGLVGLTLDGRGLVLTGAKAELLDLATGALSAAPALPAPAWRGPEVWDAARNGALVAVSADGRRGLAARVFFGTTLTLWDLEDRRPLRALANPALNPVPATAGVAGDSVPLATFTPHGLALASVAPGQARLWVVPVD